MASALLLSAAAMSNEVYGQQDVSPSRLEALVDQLTSSSFADRKVAGQKLMDAGDKAIPVLREAIANAGLERRIRLETILRRLEASSFQGRLSRLVARPTEFNASQMPFWDRFAEVTGRNEAAMKFYIRLLQAEPELFAIGSQGTAGLRNPLQVKAAQLARQNGSEEFSTDSLAAVLFLASDDRVSLRSDTSTNVSACLRGSIEDSLKQEDREQLLKLVGQWILRRAISVRKPLDFARRYPMPEGVELARRTLRGVVRKGEGTPAIMLLVDQGVESDIDILESLFDPTRDDYNGRGGQQTVFVGVRTRNQYKCLNADVAMAAAIAMRGRHPFEFGFTADPSNAPPQKFVFNEGTTGFSSDELRQSAAKRYFEAFRETKKP